MADEDITHLADLIADAIVLDARDRDSGDDADHDGPGRVLATVDGREYLITIARNTEPPGVTREPTPDGRLLAAARLVVAACQRHVAQGADGDDSGLRDCLADWDAAVADAEGDAR